MPIKSVFLLALALLVSCSKIAPTPVAHSSYEDEKSALEHATAENTVPAYDAFIKKYPSTSWIDIAVYRRDHAALEQAKRQGTPEAFRAFIKTYPNSAWIDLARYFLRYGVETETENSANQPPLQTPASGTPAASASAKATADKGAPVAPPSGAAGLER